MQPKKLKRLLRALERQGLDVSYNNCIYSVRLVNSPDAPVAEVLLPEGFPVEAKALKQLANLASVRHPSGGCVCRACATKPIQSVIDVQVETEMVDIVARLRLVLTFEA